MTTKRLAKLSAQQLRNGLTMYGSASMIGRAILAELTRRGL